MPHLGIEARKTAKADGPIHQRDLGWGAGFLEGEGSFRCDGHGGPEINADQKDRAPLARMLSLFGGSVKLHGRGYYHWRVTGARARGLMMTVYLLMSERRREQIRKALA